MKRPLLLCMCPALISLCAFTLTPAAAQEKIDLAQVARAAYAHSPALKAAREELKAVQELYPQALANWHPLVNAQAGVTDDDIDNSNFGNADGATTKDIGVFLEQPLYRGGRSLAQKDEAKARIDAQYALLKAAEQSVAAEAMIAAVNAVYEYQNLEVHKRNQEIYGQLDDATRRRKEGGEATLTDIALTQARFSGAQADVMSAQVRLDNALTRLEELTGMAPASWAHVVFPALDLPAKVSSAVAEARRGNPEVLALQHLAAADAHVIDATYGGLLPQLRFIASWSREWDPQPGIIDDSTVREVALRATIPLYEGGATKSRVREARNRAAQRSFDLRDTVLQVERDVLSQWRLAQAATLREAVHAQEVSAAETARANTQQEVYAGEKSLTDLLQADQSWLDAHAAALLTAREGMVARIRLAELTGRLTPQLLGFGEEAADPAAYLRAVRHRVFSTSVAGGG